MKLSDSTPSLLPVTFCILLHPQPQGACSLAEEMRPEWTEEPPVASVITGSPAVFLTKQQLCLTYLTVPLQRTRAQSKHFRVGASWVFADSGKGRERRMNFLTGDHGTF